MHVVVILPILGAIWSQKSARNDLHINKDLAMTLPLWAHIVIQVKDKTKKYFINKKVKIY